jgi:hypothetical protein
MPRNDESGFSSMELAIVFGLFALMMGLTASLGSALWGRSSGTALESNAQAIESSVEVFRDAGYRFAYARADGTGASTLSDELEKALVMSGTDDLGARGYVNPFTGSHDIASGSPRSGAPAPAVLITDERSMTWEQLGNGCPLRGTLMVVFGSGTEAGAREVQVFWIGKDGRRSADVGRVLPAQ